jgi:hypothetical protein
MTSSLIASVETGGRGTSGVTSRIALRSLFPGISRSSCQQQRPKVDFWGFEPYSTAAVPVALSRCRPDRRPPACALAGRWRGEHDGLVQGFGGKPFTPAEPGTNKPPGFSSAGAKLSVPLIPSGDPRVTHWIVNYPLSQSHDDRHRFCWALGRGERHVMQ